MGSHQSARMLKDEWLTPPWLIKALGPFDLDPCAPVVRPWDTAAEHYTIRDDGLSKSWKTDCGLFPKRVWLNPPYGREATRWLFRLAHHQRGIALIFARTETAMFFKQVWPKAHGLLFIEGRLHFHHVDGRRAKANAGAPSVLVAYGNDESLKLKSAALSGAVRGKYIPLNGVAR